MSAPPSPRYPALDGIRGLAAYAVLLSHVAFVTGRSLRSDLVAPFLSRGNIGVTVFFLLSGFLLYRPYARASFGQAPRPRVGAFFRRRAVRIFPALWLVVIVDLALITPRQVPIGDWPSYLLLVQTYNHHDYDTTLTQLWTLVVEVSFYALLPLLAAAVGGPACGPDSVMRRQVALVTALIAVSIGWGLLTSHGVLVTHPQAPLWLPDYLDWFAGGMALAVLSVVPDSVRVLRGYRETMRTWSRYRGTCWLVAAIVFALSTLPIGTPRTLAPASYWQFATQHWLYLIAAFFLLLPLMLFPRTDRVESALGGRVGHWSGNVSYSVYLWHPVLMLWWQRRLGYPTIGGSFGVLLLVTTASTLIVASLSWYLLEQPLLRHVGGARRRSSTAAQAPATRAITQSS